MITIDTIKLYQMLVQSERPIEEKKQHFTIIENQMFENSSSFQREPLNNANLRLWSSLKPDGVYRAKLNSIKVKIQTVRSIYFKIKVHVFLYILFYSLFVFLSLPILSLFSFIYLKPLTFSVIPPFCSIGNTKEKKRKTQHSKIKDQFIVMVPESFSFLDTATIPMYFVAIRFTLFTGE